MEEPTQEASTSRQREIEELEQLTRQLRKHVNIAYVLTLVLGAVMLYAGSVALNGIRELSDRDDALFRAIERLEHTP